MNWPEYQRSMNACARLLGAAYCHELLESKPTLEIQHPESFKEADEDNENAAFQQLVESAPPEVRGLLMAMTRTQVRGPIPHPLYDKFTPEHIDKFLDYSHQDGVNAYSFQSSNRWFYLAYAILLVVFLAFLIVFLAPNHKDLLADILKILAIFGGGFGIGFGAKSRVSIALSLDSPFPTLFC